MNRLYRAILFCLLFFFPFLVSAQIWYIGGKAGASFSNYKAKTPWKEVSNVGYTVGITAYKQVKKNYGINLELQYIQKGYYHKICNDIYDKLEANYIELPVMFDYTFIVPSLQNFKGHLNAGVYAAYWLSGKYKMQGFDESSEDFDFKESDASRFDFGPNAGGRIEYILKNGSLSLDFRYEIGVLDLQKQINDNTANTNRAFIVGLSYLKLIGN
ncbi:MAG: PorT family protein [Cyclobacteriaceae bacterium]|nr:PorT family protein [Cyclobacteriaceae bacterium]